MLNIFADALLIATRLGQLPQSPHRRNPHEFQDFEDLRASDALRHRVR